MTQTIKKSIHSQVITETPATYQEPADDPIPFLPDDHTTTALQVAVDHTPDLAPFDPAQFAANLKKVQMWTSYTGPVPESLDEYVNLPLELSGMVIQNLTNVDEDTGVMTEWVDVRFKTQEGKIISGSGKAVRQFAQLLGQQLGQGDWPTSIKVMVRRRKLNGVTREGQPKYMPTFEVLA